MAVSGVTVTTAVLTVFLYYRHTPMVSRRMSAFDVLVFYIWETKPWKAVGSRVFTGTSQQLGAQLSAPPVAEALLSVLAGFHRPALGVVMPVPAGGLRGQLCPLRVLPSSEDNCGPGSVPLGPARRRSPHEVVRPRTAERKCLPLHIRTGNVLL